MARIVFMGTPDFAVPTLRALIAHHEVVGVVTQPDRPAGRKNVLTPPPVKGVALEHGIEVFQPEKLRKAEAIAVLKRWQDIDAYVVAAFGQILPQVVLDIPRLASINVHASLLPRWRGAAPIARAIMAGDAETGAMVMRMDEGLDTGPVALAEQVAIAPDMTAGELHDLLKVTGADLMARAIAALERGSLEFKEQAAAGATYAKKIEKSETRIDWSKPAHEVHNHIRGLSPFPGAWFEMTAEGKPVRVKVLRSTRVDGNDKPGRVLDDLLTIACGEGAVRLLEVQRAGAKAMSAGEFLRGTHIAPGTRLA
jgi:methionyl-tRNA formyltransferase